MTKEILINNLNRDLSRELSAVIRYNYQSSQTTGPAGIELRRLFKEEINDELRHVGFLTDMITYLGGDPVTIPAPFEKYREMKDMVKLDYEMEQEDVNEYQQRAKEAEKCNLVELKVKLEEMAADESKHVRQLKRILEGMKA